jgi:hypothetical protein
MLRYTCIRAGVDPRYFQKEHREMSSVTSSWRERRLRARTRRAIDRALASSNSPTMREELLTLAASSVQYRNLPR